MLRISKLADYATVIMHFAAEQGSAISAAQVAQGTHLALPTVRKILKLLLNANLLDSTRGASGGYLLARPARSVSMTAIIEAVDGPIAITDCSHRDKSCEHAPHCVAKPHWIHINQIVKNALDSTYLTSHNQTYCYEDVDQ